MDQDINEQIAHLEKSLLSLDRLEVKKLITGEDGRSHSLDEIEKVIVPALENIGRGWEKGRVSLSQVYMSSRLCEELIDILLSSASPASNEKPRIAITLLEDYHLLGMHIVYSVLRASGIHVLSYGRREIPDIIALVRDDGIQILLVSVLMLRTALRVRELRAGLENAGCKVKLIVGGAPFRLDNQLWREVGADATSDTAAGAVAVVKSMMEAAS